MRTLDLTNVTVRRPLDWVVAELAFSMHKLQQVIIIVCRGRACVYYADADMGLFDSGPATQLIAPLAQRIKELAQLEEATSFIGRFEVTTADGTVAIDVAQGPAGDVLFLRPSDVSPPPMPLQP